MDTYLTIKIAALLVAGIAHRILVRAAKEEGFRWWMAALFIPGAALFYGFQRRDEYGKTVLVKLAALAVVAGAFVMQVQARIGEARQMAAAGEVQGADDWEDTDEEENKIHDNELDEAPKVTASQASPSSVRPAAQSSPVVSAPAAASSVADAPTESNFRKKLPGDLRERMAKLNQRRAAMAAEMNKVDPQNPDAVRSINIRVADYHEALARLQADLARYQ